jgi:hypothetical protein
MTLKHVPRKNLKAAEEDPFQMYNRMNNMASVDGYFS